MAGWLHGVCVGACRFVSPLCGFSLSLFCNYRGQASPRQYNACVNRKKQCRSNESKPYSNATHPRKGQNTPTIGHPLSLLCNYAYG